MQTFLPYSDYKKSMECLDYRRLGKQRVECKQILLANLNISNNRWRNHPACKMWRGNEYSLAYYGMLCCKEWRRRGYNDSLLPFFEDYLNKLKKTKLLTFSDEFHTSHKSNLLRKDKNYYSKYGWNVPDNLEYIWEIK